LGLLWLYVIRSTSSGSMQVGRKFSFLHSWEVSSCRFLVANCEILFVMIQWIVFDGNILHWVYLHNILFHPFPLP
jgi:hypothetical protein